MTADINQQIFWLEGHIKHMKRSLPDAVASGRLSGEAATYKLTAACCALQTLTQLRGLTRTSAVLREG